MNSAPMNGYRVEALTIRSKSYRVLMQYMHGAPQVAFAFDPELRGWFVIHLRPQPHLCPMAGEKPMAAHLTEKARELAYIGGLA